MDCNSYDVVIFHVSDDGTETSMVTTGLRQRDIQALIQDFIDNSHHGTNENVLSSE